MLQAPSPLGRLVAEGPTIAPAPSPLTILLFSVRYLSKTEQTRWSSRQTVESLSHKNIIIHHCGGTHILTHAHIYTYRHDTPYHNMGAGADAHIRPT